MKIIEDAAELIVSAASKADVPRLLINVGIGVAVAWVLLRLNSLFFKKLSEKHVGLHYLFFERVIGVLIIIVCGVVTLSSFIGVHTLWQTVLGGTAITSAVLAFAAQDVIKDVLGGIMISLNKPFEVGSRIELEDGTAGTVEDMNARHVVISGMDTLRYVVPNSRINAMRLVNYSYNREDSCVKLRFPVGYDSDIKLVREVIAKAIEESPYTKPIAKTEGSEEAYSPVYFLEFADSALIMAVTVYYERTYKMEVVKSDVNFRVREALIRNNIEIPYPHVTVTHKDASLHQ